MGESPSVPSRPPYLTGAASPGRHHGAASPVRLLRRRHLPAPGPRPRRQPRPVPDRASTSAITRDFTPCPTHRPPYPARAPQPHLLGEPLPAMKEPTRPPYLVANCFHLEDLLPLRNSQSFLGQQMRFPQTAFLLPSLINPPLPVTGVF